MVRRVPVDDVDGGAIDQRPGETAVSRRNLVAPVVSPMNRGNGDVSGSFGQFDDARHPRDARVGEVRKKVHAGGGRPGSPCRRNAAVFRAESEDEHSRILAHVDYAGASASPTVRPAPATRIDDLPSASSVSMSPPRPQSST